jgi:threonine-phosphate decarboxylase
MIDDLPDHGGQLHSLAARFGIPEAELLDFSANINPEGPPAAVISALRAGIEDLSTLTRYPDLEQAKLKRSIARYAGVSYQNIAVANGFVPLLEAALQALPIRRCLLPVPAFVEYQKTLSRAQVDVVPHILSTDRCFNYDPDAMIEGNEDAVLLANPQNPSGVAHSCDAIVRIITKAAERSVFVLLDEAFIDYIPKYSVTQLSNRFPNLIVFRSVTKFHGIPGLRVAYAVAHEQTARLLNEHLPPWPITTLASDAVSAALEDDAYAHRARSLNEHRRTLLLSAIEALGLHAYPPAANFLLFRLPASVDPVVFWRQMLCEHRIVLRICSNYEGLCPGHMRVAIRREEENARLLQAMRYTLKLVVG